MTIVWVHCHKSSTEYSLDVKDRISRRHRNFSLSVPAPERHRDFMIEASRDFFIAKTFFFASSPSLTLAHSPTNDVFSFFYSQIFREWSCCSSLVLSFKCRLKHSAKMLLHGFLCVLLHGNIDRGMNLKSICIDVIVRAICLCILVTPTI